jgi:YidC/Oxa1 family membrane protein insertase
MTVLLAASGSIFDPVYNAIGWLLAFFYSLVPNLGIAIILLTVTIMLILYPLTAKQAKSMIAMQRVQPEIKKLQAKYKGDKQKLNEEMMVFYKENKINPLAGCLPLLVQLPIFFALFRVLKDAYKHTPKDSALYHALCHGFGKFCGSTLDGNIAGKLGKPVVAGFVKGDTLIHHLDFLGMDLQKTAIDAHNGIMSAAPYFILVVAVMITGFLQTRQSQKRTPIANKQMGTVMKVLPVFFGLISLQFPAGLVLYFFVSNLWRLGQQEIIFRNYGSALQPVKGKEIAGGKKTEVIDVKSREADDDDAEPDPPPQPRAAAAKPKPKPAPAAAAAAASTEAKPRRGGLRGLFELPPPPEPNGEGSPRTGSNGSGGKSAKAGPPPRPPQKRPNKKKRKR